MSHSNIMPSILDREITSKEKDAFGHQDFSNALKSLIEGENNKPPYSIGLLGAWGTGKSTIKAIYLNDLEDGAASIHGDKKRSERIKAITFNAWRFGGNCDIKRALLRHVFIGLGGNDQTLKDEIYNRIKTDFFTPRSAGDIWFEIYEKALWNFIPISAFFLLVLGIAWLTKKILGIDDDLSLGITAVAISISGSFAAKYLGDTATFLIPRFSRASRIEMPKTSVEEYEELLIEQIREFKKTHRSFRRLVIFVDDLDRLSAHEMVDGLDAIRVFMELPQESLPSDFGIIFVISCDENKIAESLKERHQNANLPAAVNTRDDARKYLDRIFQFRLEIPPFPKQDMRNYAMRQLKDNAPNIIQSVGKNGGNIETIVDRMIHVDVSTPRNAIQIINSFIQSWWLAQEREYSGSGTQRVGGLLEGTITHHPISLSVICALKVDFPHFYNKLQEDQDLIRHFTNVFVQERVKFEDLPPKARHLLADYCKDGELLPEHISLRRFIGSLRGLRWPDLIQPFIHLTQDPVTRKYGPRTINIIASLVSGDTKGLLQELGRDKDNKPISKEDASLLSDIIEDLEGESEERRNHAAAVVASLSGRLPDEFQEKLLHPVCRQLEQSRRFRSTIGIETIVFIVDKVHQDYQKNIAQFLIGDAFSEEEGFTFLLETMQPPSLDEATQIADKIAQIALAVWLKYGLNEKSKNIFNKWLLEREIKLGEDKKTTLPFSQFDKWMEQYQDLLLPILGSDYTDLFIGELENNRTNNLNLQANIERCKIVFDSLFKAGEDDRPIMWEQLARMVSVIEEAAVVFAWNMANRCSYSDDGGSISIFIENFTTRLLKDMDDSEEWQIEHWEEGYNILLQIINTNIDKLESDSMSTLESLAISYSTVEETSGFCIPIVKIFENLNIQSVHRIIAEMISSLFKDLKEKEAAWLAQNIETLLSQEERNEILQKLNEIINMPEIDSKTIGKYSIFINQLSTEGCKTVEIQAHANQVFDNVINRHAEFDSYIKIIFPVAVKFIDTNFNRKMGASLHQIFNTMNSQPAHLAWIHKTISNSWPISITGIKVQDVFNNGLAVADANPALDDMDGILKSLTKILKLGHIPIDNNTQQILKLSCKLWPYHRDESLNVIKSFEEALIPKDIVQLMEGISPNDAAAFSTLRSAWQHISQYSSTPDLNMTTSLILKHSMIGPEHAPDQALGIWLDCLDPEQIKNLVELVMEKDQTPDEHLERIWAQIIYLSKKVGTTLITENIPIIFSNDQFVKTQNTILDSIDEILVLFPTEDRKNQLADTLFDAFFSSRSLEMKRHIATWIHRINGEAKLGKMNLKETPATEDDIQILYEIFPGKRKKLKRFINTLEMIEENLT